MRIFMFFVFGLFFVFSCGGNKESQPKAEDSKMQKTNTNGKVDSDNEELVYESGMTTEQIEAAKKILSEVKNDYKKVDAAGLYKTYCSLCHGKEGNLNLNNAKDLSLSGANLEERVAQIYHGAGVMTPYKGILKDEQIVSLAYYIEKFRD